MYNQLKVLIFLLLAVPVSAEIVQLLEDDLNEISGQAGITVSAKAEFETGTRISFSNENIQSDQYDANGSYTGTVPAWMVIDDITGSIEVNNLDIDIINGIGPLENKSAIQVTLPDSIEVDSLKTRGVYLGKQPEVTYNAAGNSTSHLFLLGIEMDGRLTMPANSTINIFPVEQ